MTHEQQTDENGGGGAAIRAVVDRFRAGGGDVGGEFAGMDLLLLTTVGAKTGTPRTRPVAYLADGDDYAILADNGGRDRHPAWYHNLRANPAATIEVGTRTVTVRAAVAEGPERDRLLARFTDRYPEVVDHQARTERRIPVVVLRPEPRTGSSE